MDGPKVSWLGERKRKIGRSDGIMTGKEGEKKLDGPNVSWLGGRERKIGQLDGNMNGRE